MDIFALPEHLARIGPDAVLPAFVDQMATDEYLQEVFFFMFVMGSGRLSEEQSAETLAEHLSDEDVEMRQLAVQALRKMGNKARIVVDDIKKAANDKDVSVSWNASLTLLSVLPFEEAVAAAPPRGKNDQLKGEIDQIVSQILVSDKPTQELWKRLSVIRKQGSVGYWVRSLNDSDPRVRIVAVLICQPDNAAKRHVLRSVVEDQKANPELRRFAELMLSEPL